MMTLAKCAVQRRAALAVLLMVLPGCALLSGTSDNPPVIHFPQVQSSDWVPSVASLCIEVEQSYPGLSGHTEPIAEVLQGILSRIGVDATLGEGESCEGTLRIELEVTPIAKDYAGSIEDCYTSAEATGTATISAAGHGRLTLPLGYTIHGSQIITECPTRPEEGPIEAAWVRAVMPMLSEWWGSPAIVSALQADSHVVRWVASQELPQLGEEGAAAVPVLIEMLDAAEPATRAAAALALGALGPAAAEALPALIEATGDPDESTRFNAVTAIGEIGGSEAVPALVNVLHGSDSYARYLAAEALRTMGPEAAPAVPDLIDTIDDEFKQAGWSAVDALGAIGPEAMEAVPVLIALLEAEDWTFHSDAADALASITGQDFGEDAAAWRQWWESQQ